MRLGHVSPLVATLAIVSLGACDALRTGKDEKLAFQLDADDRIIPASFNTPLAVGFRVDVLTFAADSGRTPVTVAIAQSKSGAIARVTGTSGNRITLEGRAAGRAEIEVTSSAGNDAFDINVAEVASATLAYPGLLLVPATPPVWIVEGGTARFGVSLRDAQNRLLIGYGDFPVTIEPADADVLPTQDVAHLAVRFTAPGTFELTPLGGASLEVEVVAASVIDTLALETGLDGGASSLERGKTTVAVARGLTEHGDTVLGLSGLVTVTTLTPIVCTVEESPRLGDAVFIVRGAGAGICELQATLGGHVATATLTVE